MLIQESYGSGDIRYSSYEDRTLLSEKLSIYRNEGIVYDDGITRLDGESTHSTARVSIKNYDGTFNTYDRDEGVDVSSLIGYYIVYFYQKNNNQNIGNLVYMYPDNNISLQLDADDILEYKDNTYTYIDEKDETTTVALSNSSYMIYNGKAFLPSHSRDMVPEDGNVVLVDNDSNGMYDIVLINDYKTVCVEAIITDTKSIRDRYRLHNVDLTGDNVKIYKEGSEIEFEDIKRWDILSIAESKGTASDKLVRVFVSSEYIDGKVTEKVTGNIDTIYINGEGYEVAYNLRLVPSIINGIELNKNYSFQLDINGKIAAVVEDVLSMDEYIFATGISTGKGISDSIQIKAFTYNETFEILETVNKPQVNGVQLNKNSEIYGLLGNSAGQFEPQLLKIKRNNQDKITTIYSGKAESEHGLEFFGAGSASYKTTNGIFGGIFSITEMSRVFVIPSQDNMNDEELFSIARASEIIDGEYFYRAYDVDDNLIAKAVVLSGDVAPNFGNDDYVGVVIRKSTMIDEKGEERTRVYFLHRNIEKSYLLDRNVTYVGNRPALDIGKGDVFRFYVDPASDTITHLCRHFDFKNRDSQLGEAQANNPDAPSPNYGNLLRFVYADVVSKSGSTIRARVKKADGNYETYLFSMERSNITLCRVRGEEIVQVSPGSVGDMRDFETIGDWDKTSKVFMRQRYGEVMDAVIYNFE